MKIDWFTFGAQIFNFLVLVFLLKKFLYGRIVQAMDERQRRIADNFDRAEKIRRESEQTEREYRSKIRELEGRREELERSARDEAEAQRMKWLSQARSDVQASREQWYRGLSIEEASVRRELQRQMGKDVLSAARAALRDLADEGLEQRVVSKLMQSLKASSPVPTRPYVSAEPVVVRTSFALPLDRQQQLIGELKQYVDVSGGVQFEAAASLVCGAEITFAGKKLSWNMDRYIRDAEERFMNRVGNAPAAGPPKERVHAEA